MLMAICRGGKMSTHVVLSLDSLWGPFRLDANYRENKKEGYYNELIPMYRHFQLPAKAFYDFRASSHTENK